MIFNSVVLALFIWALGLVQADVSVLKPTSGSTYTATGTMAISWEDDGNAPLLDSDISTLSILLCTGPNSNINCFYTIVNAVAPSTLGTSYSFSISSAQTLAASGSFYLQFYARASNGGYTIHYSNRFTISGMTGSLTATAGDSTSPPNDEISYSTTTAATDSMLDPDTAYTIPYTMQTGIYRYAPMQRQPVSKVTMKLSASRRYPTTSVSLFTTWTLQPDAVTTTTASITYSTTQAVNWATPAPQPTVVGYYAASEALARTINAKSKRGYVDL
ncbi:uncharacterized protein SAPINGB_P004377 [Magnusiomyces paraingens]|uniref:Uncharacterized protein n=1 Tax=Magnusiomyces paraingens TaxID=2606893 RepID=A0A5E8BU67_9ASCO|nr:uncharacterized protein SAPINGB_P004377 [Saprochaete ingens]VVT55016.1 unnamed protein product [Saprochaete ingens]